MLVSVFCFLVLAVSSVLSAQDGPRPELLRLARGDSNPSGTDTLRRLLAFEEDRRKRFDSLSGATFDLAKRQEFDEMDKYGFPGFEQESKRVTTKRGRRDAGFARTKRCYLCSLEEQDEEQGRSEEAGFKSFEKSVK